MSEGRRSKKEKANELDDGRELIEALDELEKEKGISKEVLLDTIETSLVAACKNEYGKADNIHVNIDRNTGKVLVYAEKTVVEEVEDPTMEISLANAKLKDPTFELGDVYQDEVTPKNFGRIAAQKAKQVVVQKIREEERKSLYERYYSMEKDIVTGIVQRYNGNNICVNLGKVDATLTEKEQVKGEVFRPTERIKLYVVDVKDGTKGPRITVSRTHPELVRRLFEAEVAEVKDGTVEIRSIAREAGSRTKIAVYSNDPDVDPVGACVGVNGSRVNAVVDELRGEKIDIICWDDDPRILIENALSPAKVVSVYIEEGEKAASVIVPDYQLSLAIGKEGQNARLAARLTGYKIDIKSESQADALYQDEQLFEDEGREDGFYEDEDYRDGDSDSDKFSDEEFADEEFSDEEFDDEEQAEDFDEDTADEFSDEEAADEEQIDPEEEQNRD